MWERCIRILTIPFILVLWQILSSVGVLPTLLVPSPSQIFGQFGLLVGPRSNPPFLLERDLLLTLVRLATGLVIATVVGIVVGLATGKSPTFRKVISPYISIFSTVPVLAMSPIVFAVSGLGNAADLVIVIIAAVIPMVIECEMGVLTLPQHFIWSAQSLGAFQWTLLSRVTIPSMVSPLVNGFRQATSFAWRALLAMEGISAIKYGIGYSIFQAGTFFDSKTIFANIFVTIVIGLAIESSLRLLERRTVRKWGLQRA